MANPKAWNALKGALRKRTNELWASVSLFHTHFHSRTTGLPKVDIELLVFPLGKLDYDATVFVFDLHVGGV